jgi:hypothetical protein
MGHRRCAPMLLSSSTRAQWPVDEAARPPYHQPPLARTAIRPTLPYVDSDCPCLLCPQTTAGHSQPSLHAPGVVAPRVEAAPGFNIKSDPGVWPGRGARARVPFSSSLADSARGQQKLGGVESNGGGGTFGGGSNRPPPVIATAPKRAAALCCGCQPAGPGDR